MMKYWLKYYTIDSDGSYVLNLETQIYLTEANVRKSAEPKNNTCEITLNNPILHHF